MNKRFVSLLWILAASAAPGTAATITLDAPLQSGGIFDVLVDASNVFSPPHDGDILLAYGFNVLFDSSVVSYLGETAGALFTDVSNNPGFGAEVGGTGFLLPGDFTEPLNLATLHFEVVGLGPTTISIKGDPASSLDEGLVYLSGFDSISASVSVTAVPEPAVFSLLSATVAGLALFLRRCRLS